MQNLCPLYRECPLYGVSVVERFHCIKLFKFFLREQLLSISDLCLQNRQFPIIFSLAGHVSDEASPDDSTGIWAVISLLERIEKKMENMETRINHRQDDANKRLENGIINLKKKVDSVSIFTY